MTYWLCVTNEENWEVIKRNNIWGVPKARRKTLQKVEKGDKLVIYVRGVKNGTEQKPPRIVAAYEVSSEPFEDAGSMFLREYPYRVKIRPIKIFEKPVEFRSLVPKLAFIKNKQNWNAYVRSSMRKIPEEDFETIVSLAK